ncbi:SPFH domain-containing protein [Streptomyces sp. NPDC048606]|uniref:SPFH domain-containing protein n=1 Tax=Streptomyces sp. NPDC048606 TaxID=3154726 RepID=UPI00342D9183
MPPGPVPAAASFGAATATPASVAPASAGAGPGAAPGAVLAPEPRVHGGARESDTEHAVRGGHAVPAPGHPAPVAEPVAAPVAAPRPGRWMALPEPAVRERPRPAAPGTEPAAPYRPPALAEFGARGATLAPQEPPPEPVVVPFPEPAASTRSAGWTPFPEPAEPATLHDRTPVSAVPEPVRAGHDPAARPEPWPAPRERAPEGAAGAGASRYGVEAWPPVARAAPDDDVPAPGPWPVAVVPHPEPDPEPAAHDDEPDPEPAPEEPYARSDAEPWPAAPGTGVPGPGVADLVARAVERGMGLRHVDGDADTAGLPTYAPPSRGTAVTDIPVHLPFLAHPSPPAPTAPRPAAVRAPRAAAGRRVPRGDDRLREHRGPVLPGWIAVAVGGLALAGCAAVLLRAGVVPAPVVAAFGVTPRAYQGLRATHWPPLAFLGIVTLLALGGLGRAKAGHAWVLTLFGRYRGTVRRTGLTWISPLLLRRRVDVRLRHWRSEPMAAVDCGGLALRVVVQVVWQVKDTARATLAVEDHTEYLAEQVESAMARVLSQLPADAFHEDAPTLRDAEAVGDALTRMLAAETEAVGIEVFSAQPTRIEYAPEVAEAMRRRRVAAIDAKHRDTVLTSVVDAVDDTVRRLTSRGIVELDDYERKALVKDLTVAFYTGRGDQ